MHYVYRSRFGTFRIAPRTDGRWLLAVDDEALGTYKSAAAAADDVYLCASGHYPWDAQLSVNAPCDLSEWQRVQ